MQATREVNVGGSAVPGWTCLVPGIVLSTAAQKRTPAMTASTEEMTARTGSLALIRDHDVEERARRRVHNGNEPRSLACQLHTPTFRGRLP